MNRPLIIDSFAGGGGASTGIEMALGRSPDIAINHNPAALAMHEANHPQTMHLSENIYKVDPLDYVAGKHVGLAWFSPDCKHFSKAKGGKPVERNIRDLAWIVVLWGRRAKPDVIFLENVEEFREWGPLIETDRGLMPDPDAKGHTFEQWCKALRSLGYKIEWRELRACDFGAPTIRKRFFLIARRDGKKIVWPNPTHGKPTDPEVISGKKLPWRTAAEIIDWSIPCPSIFDTSEQIMTKHGLRAVRPLAPATMSRTARGLKRYVLDAARPFLVNLTHGARLESVDEPFNTITGAHRGEKSVIAPSLISVAHGYSGGRREYPLTDPMATVTSGGISHAVIAPVLTAGQHGGSNRSVEDPHHTITASKKDQNAIIVPHLSKLYGKSDAQTVEGPAHTIATRGKSALVSAFVAQHNNDSRRDGGVNPGRAMHEPLSTVTQTGSQQGVIAASLMSLKGSDRRDSDMDEPHPTVLAGGRHSALVTPFMTKYYGTGDGARVDEPAHTVTMKDRFAFVEGEVAPPPLTDDQITRAHAVADFMREHGFWDEREVVTVTIGGDLYTIVDIGMRMLTPRELFGAQGFPPNYIIDPIYNGKPLSKSDQIGCCGNSVSPPMAAALVGANCSDLIEYREAAE
ncbi:DNA cytosine methyltransferase [Phyllobacterium chamaecytisi]|uniref:DNA cytosine methyltransferase n=1 Tax=Phyllobacterium chamaecytisi TaxID=2876082 RepID=UPI001CCB0F1C|nr:DNA cytosine methyltransferase [Phyllobacterium sp. KW56]MBZ9600720.1 DNA cytosine methyltransferase [Phyllobacterium sp. KW56]